MIIKKILRRYKRWKLDRYFLTHKIGPVFDLGNGDRIHLHRDEISYTLFTTNNFENYNRALWEKVLQPGMIVFDVGANCGIYTLAASRRITSKGQVFSFEPNLREREKLVDNLSLSGPEKAAE